MSNIDFKVNVSPSIAAELIVKTITENSVTGKVIDTYIRKVQDRELVVLIMEKYYMRASRVTLTVTLDNLDGATNVHVIGSGGAEGIIPIDWGAGKSFAATVERALSLYMLEE